VPVRPQDAKSGAPLTEVDRRATTAETQRLPRAMGALRIVVGLVLFGLVVLAVVRSWEDVRTALERVSPLELVFSEVLVLAGLAVSVLTWRVVVRELGSIVNVTSAAKIYLLGQLAKYVPGSFWALAVQMELARGAGVPRARGMAASVVSIGINVVTGLALGAFLLPSIGGGTWRMAAALALLAVCAAVLSPPILTRVINFVLRVVRRPQLDARISWHGILTASGWSLASWGLYGLSVWVLAVAVGAPAGESLPLCMAGMALAMTLGFLVVVAPSGIGVRELAIVAALAPVLERPEALAVAFVARLLFTIADLIAAAAVVPVRIQESEAV
jgi:uncharacterized membrane protein YbhN (UPF0104 family)